MLLVALVPPIAEVFGIAPLNAAEWGIAIGCAVLIVPLVEMQKIIEGIAERAAKKRKARTLK